MQVEDIIQNCFLLGKRSIGNWVRPKNKKNPCKTINQFFSRSSVNLDKYQVTQLEICYFQLPETMKNLFHKLWRYQKRKRILKKKTKH